MKKIIGILLSALILLGLSACSQEQSAEPTKPTELSVIATYEVADEYNPDLLNTMVKHYKMSDGTWRTDDHTYKYRLEITGRMPNAVKDTTYVYLSNIEEISFSRAMYASGISSSLEDYFDAEVAQLVAIK